MVGKFFAHIRRQWMGALALFLVLTGGTAWATHEVIDSSDVVDNSLLSADLKNNAAVKSVDVRDDTLTGGGLNAADLNPGSVTGSEVLDGSLGTAEFSSSIPAAHVTHSTSQSIPDSTPTVLNFDTENYDTASMHDTATNNSRLTAPVTGIYAVTVNLLWDTQTPPTGRREFTLALNGSTAIAEDDRGSIAVPTQGQLGTTQVRLVAGDFVEVGVTQTSGGSLSVFPLEFSMPWLAPGT